MAGFSWHFWFLIFSEAFMAAGYAISFPFLAVYLNSIRNISMSIIGFFLSVSLFISSIGNIYGGELSDKIGRKQVMLISLFLRATFILIIAFIIAYDFSSIWLFIIHPLGLISGSLFNPAARAWVADNIQIEKRLNAYGIMRIGTNLGWAIGPGIGGVIAISSYSKMFFITSIIYFISGFIIYLSIKDSNNKSYIKSYDNRNAIFSFLEIKNVLKDKNFSKFCVFSFIISAVMSQLVVPVSLYSKRYLLFSEREIGLLFSLNGSIVVFFQYFISNYFSKFKIVNSLSIGSLFYGIDYFIFGFSKLYYIAAFSMIIITFGEIILSPALHAFAANISPKNKEGRYLGIAAMIHQAGNSLGVFLGSFLIDNFAKYYQQVSWSFMFILGFIAFLGFKKLSDK